MDKEVKKRYSLGIKNRGGGYSKVVKDMTKSQFEKYYDKVVENGGKVIGIFTDDIK
jgi:hypothetical protein